jgi:hypothetical protein
MPTEDIWFPVFGTGSIINQKVKFGKLLSPRNLTLIKNLGHGKIVKILRVCEDQN